MAVAGLFCGMCALNWQKVESLQELEGQKLQIRGQVLEYPEERYHRYHYRIQVEGLGKEGEEIQKTDPFVLRLSASLPLACEPYD